MRLPSKSCGDLGNGRAAVSAQHRDEHVLLARTVLAQGERHSCLSRLGRLCHAEQDLRLRRCPQGDGAAIRVVTPNGVVIQSDDFFNEPVFEQAFTDVTNSAAFEGSGDWKDQPVIAGAGGGQDGGLGVG